MPATPPSGPDGFQLAEEQGDAAAEWPFATPSGIPTGDPRVLSWRSRLRLHHHHAEVPARIGATAGRWPGSSTGGRRRGRFCPTLVALLVLDRPLILRLALLYLGGGALVIALFTAGGQLLRGTLNSAPLTNVFWALLSLGWTASVPLALVAITGWRRVRAVMPLALAGTLLFGLARCSFANAVGSRHESRSVQIAVPGRRRAYIDRDDSVRAVLDSLSAGRLDRMATADRAGERVREEAIQRRATRHRLLVGRCRGGNHGGHLINYATDCGESLVASPPLPHTG